MQLKVRGIRGTKQSVGTARRELPIRPVFKEELQMLRIQPELVKGPANLVCGRLIGGRPRPSIAAACVFELQVAAIVKMQPGLIKSRIDFVSGRPLPRIFSKIHKSRVTKPPPGQSENLEEECMFIALFVILLLLWIFGFTAMHVASFAIHILLLLAVVSLIIHFVRPHSRPPAA